MNFENNNSPFLNLYFVCDTYEDMKNVPINS